MKQPDFTLNGLPKMLIILTLRMVLILPRLLPREDRRAAACQRAFMYNSVCNWETALLENHSHNHEGPASVKRGNHITVIIAVIPPSSMLLFLPHYTPFHLISAILGPSSSWCLLHHQHHNHHCLFHPSRPALQFKHISSQMDGECWAGCRRM